MLSQRQVSGTKQELVSEEDTQVGRLELSNAPFTASQWDRNLYRGDID